MRKQEKQPNGNSTTYDYYLNQMLKSKVTKKSNGTIVNKHALEYNANGNRVKDTLQLINADGTTVNSVLNYTYDARGRVTKYEKTGDNATTETYQLDLSGNVVKSTKDGKTNTYNYERNRLVSAVLDGTKVDYQYDPYGRLHTVNALVSGQSYMLQHYTYDGFNHVISHKKLKEGTVSDFTTVKYSYDPMDRRITRTEHAGTSNAKTTHLNYLGLSNKVLNEEVAGKITRSYTYSPWGQRLSMVKTMDDGTKQTSYYGYNPHTDVEMLYTQDGSVRATYGYTAYGDLDKKTYTFKGQSNPNPSSTNAYNVYRFNHKRWDPQTKNYDMGFRNYSPDLKRFLTRDMYKGALKNLNLSTDPITMNRYAFGGGNPISNIELDGHIPAYMKEHPEKGFKAWKEVFGETYSQSMIEASNTAGNSNGNTSDFVSGSSKKSLPAEQGNTTLLSEILGGVVSALTGSTNSYGEYKKITKIIPPNDPLNEATSVRSLERIVQKPFKSVAKRVAFVGYVYSGYQFYNTWTNPELSYKQKALKSVIMGAGILVTSEGTALAGAAGFAIGGPLGAAIGAGVGGLGISYGVSEGEKWLYKRFGLH